MRKFKPFILLGPGDAIKEELAYYGWDEEDFANLSGLDQNQIKELLKNKIPITNEIAQKLSRVFRQSPQFWLNMQNNYCSYKKDRAPYIENEI